MQQPKLVPAVKEPKPVPAVKEPKPVSAVEVDPVITNPVVVIGSQFLAANPVNLIIKRNSKSLSKGAFNITDVDGTAMFTIEGKLLSLSDRRTLLDAAGNLLITLQQTTFSAHSRWKVFRGNSSDDKDLLFTARKSKILQIKTGLSVFMAGNTKEDVADFKVKGSENESSGTTIYLGESNTIIAQMQTQFSGFRRRISFAVTVYPNVDYAFIVALMVILEEITIRPTMQG